YGKQFLGPQFRLYPCPEGIKINKMESSPVLDFPKVLPLLGQGKGSRNLLNLIPRSGVHALELFLQFRMAQSAAIIELPNILQGYGMGFHPDVVDSKLQFGSFQKGDQGIEPCPEPNFKNVDVSVPEQLESMGYEYVLGFLYRPVHGVVLFVPIRDPDGLGTVRRGNDLPVQVQLLIRTPSASKR